MSDKIDALDSFSNTYRMLKETDKKNFSRIVSKFLKETFILKELDEDRDDFFFCSENKEMMISYFELIDYEFVYDMFNSLFYIKTTEDRNRVRLSKFDTAFILILRKMYFIKRKEITSDNKIVVLLSEIMEEVKTSKIFSDDKKVSNYDETLRKLRNYKIINYIATKIDENISIQILPSILIIVSSEKIDEIIAKINGLKKETIGEEVEEDENINEDQND